MTKEYLQTLKQQKVENLPEVNSIGLFSEGLQIVPQSFGEKEESINAAISRLQPKLKSFLATRFVEMTLNPNSSQLDVEVSMNLVEQPNQIFARISTLKARNNRPDSKQIYPEKNLPLNKLFQFQVKNNSPENLYVAILLIDSTGGLEIVFPLNDDDKISLASNKILKSVKIKATETGLAETLVIASRSKLDEAVYGLKRIAQELKIQEQNKEICPDDRTRGDEVIGDLLNGLSGESTRSSATTEVKTSNIATLSFSFEVG
ncbi:MAG: hypothetical protein AAFW70_19790 [Cyanobacteria bacterium J06635_10]